MQGFERVTLYCENYYYQYSCQYERHEPFS